MNSVLRDSTTTAPRAIYMQINQVKKALASDGIPKGQRNTQQNYNFRGIDDFLATLAPLLAENNIDIFPIASEHQVTEAESKSGGVLFKTVIKVSYDLVCTLDGSSHSVTVFGEAMDSGDKGTNKAFSAAYKLMAWQTFCIPTGDKNDTENQSYETHGTRNYQQRPQAPAARQPVESAPICPSCGSTTATGRSIKGNGYYCFPKRGGCGAAFDEADLERQLFGEEPSSDEMYGK